MSASLIGRISAYQKCVAETVQRFAGFVAKYMGERIKSPILPRKSAKFRNAAKCRDGPDSDIKTRGVVRTPSLSPLLLRFEASNPSTSACFFLLMLGWRPIDAASSLDLPTSQDRQSAANMKRRRTLRNYAGNRRMIDTAYDLATWQPSAC
jgi:hypothetical protein